MTRTEAALRILEALTMAKFQVPTADEAIEALEVAHLEWDGVIDAQAQEWVA